MKDIILVACTRKSEDEYKNLQIYTTLEKQVLIGNIKRENIHIQFNNNDGLGKHYNKFINEEYKDKILLCVHDDIELFDIMLLEKLNAALKRFDIVGLAGSSMHNLSTPVVWNKQPAANWSGMVSHVKGDEILPTFFGTFRKPCIVIDGVFMAINVSVMLNKQHKFDEQFDFHFYDLDFSLGGHLKGIKVGTWDVYIQHYSVGEFRNNKSWEKNQELYIQKYKQGN